MSHPLDALVAGVTQSYFGEDCTLKQGASTKTIKGIFAREWVESNGVSTYELTVEFKQSDLITAASRSDEVTRGLKTYRVSVAQEKDGGIITFILKEK
ncbi:MAG: hypothetical protein RBT63_04800 [Bdellovibrionales bacterium]|jgi:hypothetical protein|nr:hypothetical protein [Bdellovibrionales bacterium]